MRSRLLFSMFFGSVISRTVFFSSVIFSMFSFSLVAKAQLAPFCSANNVQNLEFCQRMKHLRATSNLVDSQRVLMKLDYEFLSAMSRSLDNNTQALVQLAPSGLADHKAALSELNELSKIMEQQAKSRNPDVLVTANNLSRQCLNCHNSSNPGSQIKWNDMFTFSWDKISKDCSAENRNPFLCKSMNALGSNYNHLITAYVAKIEDYEITATVTNQVVQILRQLKELNFQHLGEANRVYAENSALEVIALAKAKDSNAFNKARDLNQACMKCHNEVSIEAKTDISKTKNSWSFAK